MLPTRTKKCIQPISTTQVTMVAISRIVILTDIYKKLAMWRSSTSIYMLLKVIQLKQDRAYGWSAEDSRATARFERGIVISKRFKRNDKESSIMVVISSQLYMLRQWIACFLSVFDSYGGDNVQVCHQEVIRGAILYIGCILFWSLITKELDQVRPLADSKKAILNLYAIFENPDHVAKIVS